MAQTASNILKSISGGKISSFTNMHVNALRIKNLSFEIKYSFLNQSRSLNSITFKMFRSSDYELASRKHNDDALNENIILRFNQTLQVF